MTAVAAAKAPKRRINPDLLKKYESFTITRDEHMDMDIRGEKARKIAEWAIVIKEYSINHTDKALSIPMNDFVRMMGSSKHGAQYVRTMLKTRFGIPAIRILVGSDRIAMWSRTPVKE